MDMVEQEVKNKSYLTICDFDEHFDNPDNDWTNKQIGSFT